MDDGNKAKDYIIQTLRDMIGEDQDEIDVTQLKYVLYARKSTKGKNKKNRERQEQSIPSQLKACKDAANRDPKIHISKIIIEIESAKQPGARDKFNKIMEQIEVGVYDGIISYAPDRLARNMKEGGEIIDKLDRREIKDLRFATYSFENTPMGKMLLGVSFVLSKNYSDGLSVVVKRGNKAAIEAANFIGKFKHGYYKNKDGRLYPDTRNGNWELIKNVFDMRLNDNTTGTMLAKYLNKNGYEIHRADGRHKYVFTDKRVSEMLRDPFYAGILVYGPQIIDLQEVYDFTPIIEPDDFLKINKADSFLNTNFRLARKALTPVGISANMMNGMIICNDCKESMSAGITKKYEGSGEDKKLIELRLFYRCDTEDCRFFNKSCRAKYVTDFIYDFLDKHKFTSREEYKHYLEDMAEEVERKTADITQEIRSLIRQRTEKTKDYENTKALIRDEPKEAEHFKDDLDELKADIKEINNDIETNEKLKSELSDTKLTYEEYLELFGKVTDLLKKTYYIDDKDAIIRKFFLNFTVQGEMQSSGKQVKQWSVVDYELAEPFATFIKNHNSLSGRGDRARTCDLTAPSRTR